MKKKILALIMVATMACAVFAGCGSTSETTIGGSGNDATGNTNTNTTSELEDYVNSSEVQKSFDTTIEQVMAMGVYDDVKIYAEGNVLYYDYYYNASNSANFDGRSESEIKDVFDNQMAAYQSTLVTAAEEIRKESGVADAVIQYSYYSNTGKLLYTNLVDPSDTSNLNKTTDAIPTPPVSEAKGGSTIEDYISTPAIKTQLDSTIKSTSASGMTLDIWASDNTLYYDFYFDAANSETFSKVSDSQLESIFKQSMESQRSTFESAISTIKTGANVPEATLVITYYSNTNKLLYTESFKAK